MQGGHYTTTVDRGQSQPAAEIVLRPASSERPPLKEKFVDIFMRFFRGEDPSVDWDELLLLKVNVGFLERCMALTSEEEFISLSRTFRGIFRHSLQGLCNSNAERVGHALEIISALFHGLFRKRFQNFGPQVIEIVCGFDKANYFFGSLIGSLQHILLKNPSDEISSRALRVLTMLASGSENPHHNSLIEYILPEHKLFDTLVAIMGDDNRSKVIGPEAALLLCCVSSYQRHEARNEWRQLIVLLSGQPLKRLAVGLTKLLSEYFRNRHDLIVSSQSIGFVSILWQKLASLLLMQSEMPDVSPSTSSSTSSPSSSASVSASWSIGSVLLLLYDLCYLNATFRERYLAFPRGDGEGESVVKQLLSVSSCFAFQSIPPVPPPQTVSSLAGFDRLAFSTDYQRGRLCMLTLTALSDLCPFELHDPSILATMYSFNRSTNVFESHGEQPLAYSVYDAISSFLLNNLRRTLHIDLYSLAIQVLSRLLIQQVRLERTLPYARFSTLWYGLMRTIELLIRHGDELPDLSGGSAIELCAKIVNIFNIFLAYGDSILPSAEAFDSLVYELTRQKKLFDILHMIAEKAAGHSQSSPWCTRILNDLASVRCVTSHFSQEIGLWAIEHSGDGLNVEFAMEVVKEHYDTLKLSVNAHLDWVAPYSEHPAESPFLRQYVKSLVQDARRILKPIP